MAKTLSDRLQQTRNIRDALLDRIEGRAGQDHNSYSIGDRSISKMSIEELGQQYKIFDREVQRLERKYRRSTGGNGHIQVRF